MDPLSNKLPPYSPYEIEVYAYQLPHRHVINQQVVVPQSPTPFEMISTQEAKQAELNKKKEKEKKEKKDKKNKADADSKLPGS